MHEEKMVKAPDGMELFHIKDIPKTRRRSSFWSTVSPNTAEDMITWLRS